MFLKLWRNCVTVICDKTVLQNIKDKRIVIEYLLKFTAVMTCLCMCMVFSDENRVHVLYYCI